MDRIGAGNRARPVPLPGVQRREVGRSIASMRGRSRPRRRRRRRIDQRARSESDGVSQSRRQADSVSRLERSADFSGQQRRLLRPRVADAGKPNLQDGYRLFMVPGMGHCRGGEGPNAFDMVAALEQWVEQKKAPDQIVAAHADQRRGRSHAATLPLSAGRDLPRIRKRG